MLLSNKQLGDTPLSDTKEHHPSISITIKEKLKEKHIL
jgi:hypothetical protein